MLPFHVVAGGLAIVAGAVALLVRKGGPVHRRAGLLFVAAMLGMGISGSLLALRNSPTDPNVLAGLTTAYFVVTALATVRPAAAWTGRIMVPAVAVAVGIGLAHLLRGVQAFNSPRGALNGVPFPMYFLLGTVLWLAAAGDVRVMRRGMPRGGPRLARHLWRMCFALFMAAGSFFSIRERVATILPEALTTAPMRALPILLVFVAMFYWLWRVRSRRPIRAAVVVDGRVSEF